MGLTSLQYISRHRPSIASDAHIVFCVVKDEVLRLPYFITYYRQKGFDQFIFIDNNSSDGTREFLLEQADVAMFHTADPFGSNELNWKNGLPDRFGAGHWILVVDADEILVWPGSERETIRDLSARMSNWGAEILFAPMLDMYSDKSFGHIGYQAGEPFINYAPYFDHGPYFYKHITECPYMDLWGGVRSRIWNDSAVTFHPPNIAKVPFLRWRTGQRFTISQHRLFDPAPMAPMRGALLHFKMLDDLPVRCEVAIANGQHYEDGRELRVLRQAMQKTAGSSFFDPAYSIRYTGTHQLADLKLIEAESYPAPSADDYKGISF